MHENLLRRNPIRHSYVFTKENFCEVAQAYAKNKIEYYEEQQRNFESKNKTLTDDNEREKKIMKKANALQNIKEDKKKANVMKNLSPEYKKMRIELEEEKLKIKSIKRTKNYTIKNNEQENN